MSDVNATVLVAAPSAPVQPTVVLSVHAVLGSCVSLTVDLSGAIGNAGRSWVSVDAEVVCERAVGVAADCSALQHWLDTHFTASPPTTIPSELLAAGYNYTFTVTLCNVFAQFGKDTRRVSVVSSLVPVGTIPGAMTSSQSLSFSAVVAVPQCNSSLLSRSFIDDLQLTWKVSRDGELLRDVVSTSRDPMRMLLPSYALSANALYSVSETATAFARKTVATTSVRVTRGEIVARLVGGKQSRNVRSSESVLLDASPSYDEDKESVAGSATGLHFEWSCMQIQPVQNNSCDALFDTITLSQGLRLSALESAANTTARVSLTVLDANRERNGSLFVDVRVTNTLSAVVSVASNAGPLPFNSAAFLQLYGAVSVPANASGALHWQCDTLSNDAFELAALFPLSLQVNALPVTRSISLSLAESPNALVGGRTHTFSLFAALTQPGTSSASEIADANPAPGTFAVTPQRQEEEELSAPFLFLCDNWQDVDLPLSYAFGYKSASGANLVLRSRLERQTDNDTKNSSNFSALLGCPVSRKRSTS